MIRKTQVDSLKKLKQTIYGKRKAVYNILLRKGSSTNRMIAKSLGWEINSVTGRVTELVNKGRVTDSGTFKDKQTNRTVTLWKAI